MRNASESGPVRPEQRMSPGAIADVLRNATMETHLRIWFWPLSEIDEGDIFEEDGILYRDDEEMLHCEVTAVQQGTHLDLVVTECDPDDCVLRTTDSLTDSSSNSEVAFNVEEADCIHHVEVIKVGLPPVETIDYGGYDEEFSADPANDHILLDGNSVGQTDTLALYHAMGRWLQHRGVTL